MKSTKSLGGEIFEEPELTNTDARVMTLEELLYDPEDGGDISTPISDFTIKVRGSRAVITAYAGNAEAVAIPSKYGTYDIVEIAYQAFIGKHKLKRVIIPEGIMVIGEEAFSGCVSLGNVKLPESLLELGRYAFCGCISFTHIHIPKNVVEIGEGAFGKHNDGVLDGSELSGLGLNDFCYDYYSTRIFDCSAIEKISVAEGNSFFCSAGNCLIRRADNAVLLGCDSSELPLDTERIEAFAFAMCRGLSKIKLPKSLKFIGEYAFLACSGLTQIKLGSGVEQIGRGAFAYCSSISAIIGSSDMASSQNPYNASSTKHLNKTYCTDGNCIVERKTARLIAGCKNTAIPSTAAIIGEAAFCGCDKLSAIELPEAVTVIERNAFLGCTELASVKLPKKLHKIGAGAFYSCESLKSLELPASVEELGECILSHCHSLEKIEVASGNKKYYSAGNCLLITESQTLISGCNSSIVPPDTKSVADRAFLGCNKLYSVTLPHELTKIRIHAFAFCENLRRIKYLGTMAEWEALYKGDFWNDESREITVQCTDGYISPEYNY